MSERPYFGVGGRLANGDPWRRWWTGGRGSRGRCDERTSRVDGSSGGRVGGRLTWREGGESHKGDKGRRPDAGST